MAQPIHTTPSNEFPMVHPVIFAQNPLIHSLAEDPFWTVSDDNKQPVNARILLETGRVYNAKFDGESPLVTLNQLDENPNLQAVNRAYRLRARENRIIAIDVEPHAPEEMKQQVLQFPAHYTELSKNGGVHLLIAVPEDLITDRNRYMFDDLSVFKEPVPKIKDGPNKGKDERKANFEVLFNDHFVTFTKRMFTQKPCIDYNQNPNEKQMLASFLEAIVRLDAQKKKERELVKQYRINIMHETLNDEKQKDIQKFISLKPFEEALDQAAAKNVSDFAGDYSRYEMSVANGLAYHALRVHKLAKDTISFRDMAKSLTEQDIAYAIYMLLQEIVPYREKHDENREDMPWLLYTSKRAYEFVKAQNDKREKERRERKK